MEIRDWSVARELDIKAAIYIRDEERRFWTTLLSLKPPDDDDIVIEQVEGEAQLGNR